MKYAEARLGRALVVRLEDGDVVHECVEEAARRAGIHCAAVLLVGGADEGSRIVVGPEDGRADPIVPMEYMLHAVHEVAGVGTLFPDERGGPVLHLHAAFGRGEAAHAGCIRRGVRTWVVGEVVLLELVDCTARRVRDTATGFDLLEA